MEEAVAEYQDRPLRWKDLLTLFLPASAAPLLPLLIGFWREQYALTQYGPAAAASWGLPWYRLSVFALIPLTGLALIRIRQAHRRIVVYPQGIVIYGKGLQHQKLSWTEIQGIRSAKTAFHFLGIPLRSKFQVQLLLAGRRPLKLDHRIQNLEELCARIKAKVYPRMLRSYRLAYQNGKSLDFGPVFLHQDTLTFKDTTLPWTSVIRLEPVGGFLQVETNQNNKLTLPIQSIPNIEVLLQIVQESAKHV